jgi:predicted AlkP superfamily pyrophosphatase or phosphodiesterase
MASSRAGRVVILVLDALGPEFVDAARMPWLSRLAERGAIAALGGIAELVASTGPNHATLLTGASLAAHGVLANRVFAPDGGIDADPRVRIPTLLDRAKAAGRRTAIAASDPDILNTVNGHLADLAWPPAADIDRHGTPRPKYLPDAATAETLIAAVRSGHDLIVGQLQGVDTAVHRYGIDAAETRAARAEIDDIVGAMTSALADLWSDTLLVIVSDHRAEDVADHEPVRLAAALAGLADVIEDGSAALVRPQAGKLAAVLARAIAAAGVAGACPLDGEHLAAWCEPGRVFGRERAITMAGCHGNLTTRPCVAVVAGGHPTVGTAAAAVRRAAPSLRLWAPIAATALAI